MKKAVSLLLIFVMTVLGVLPVFADVSAPKLTAGAAVLIDAKTGNILFEKNSDKRMYPASTTKIMTAMVALDAVNNNEISLDQPLALSEAANDTLALDGSSIGLKVGETMILSDLLRGLLIASGNDAAAVIAEGVSGSIDSFVELMNKKAAALKLKDTHFTNPHGLHDENHYTTASDMAKMAREAMKNETFRSIVECAHIYLDETNMSDKRYFINTNNLVSRMRYPYYFYEKATGIKTGSTTEAGYCLVSSAEDDDKSVISVIFNAADISTSHNESKTVLEYGLKGFSNRQFAHKDDILAEVDVKQASDGTDHILLYAEKSLDILVTKDYDPDKAETVTEVPEKVYAPIEPGQVIGKAKFLYDGKEIGSVNIVSNVKIKRHILGFLMSFGEWIWKFRTVKIVVFGVLGAALAFAALVFIGLVRAVKKSKSKKRRTNRYNPPRY